MKGDRGMAQNIKKRKKQGVVTQLRHTKLYLIIIH